MNLIALIAAEFRAILTNSAVMLTVFGGVIFYSFLYPLPYAHQIPREQNISVVNLDKSQTSYQLERMVNATPQIQINQRDHSIKAAKRAFLNGEISGFLVIPKHFYKDLLLGKSPVLAYAGDASFFLVYGTVVEGLATAGATLAAQAKVSKLVMQGEPLALASKGYSPIAINMKPSFNASLGYINYVVPAVFVLILQQTLAMAAGLLVATQKSDIRNTRLSSLSNIFWVRTLVLTLIYLILSAYYFGFSFDFYQISRLAAFTDMLKITVPFLLSACFLGLLLGSLLPRKELVTVVVLVSSLPLIFSAGIIWPVELIPAPIIWVSSIFPSTLAINAYINVNQLGASWQQVIPLWIGLWVQVIVWGSLAFYSYRKTLISLSVQPNDTNIK